MSLLTRNRMLLFIATIAMALLVACGPGGMCESDRDRDERERVEMMRMQAIAKAASPTPTASAAASTPAASATPAASSTPAPFGGKIALGFDHPPFAPANANVGGNSVGIVCGVLTGVPSGSIITINLTGGTGAPATVNGPVGGDGAFMLPFPITSYGPMNATLGAVKTAAGAALTGSVPPATPLQVAAGADVACNAR